MRSLAGFAERFSVYVNKECRCHSCLLLKNSQTNGIPGLKKIFHYSVCYTSERKFLKEHQESS